MDKTKREPALAYSTRHSPDGQKNQTFLPVYFRENHLLLFKKIIFPIHMPQNFRFHSLTSSSINFILYTIRFSIK